MHETERKTMRKPVASSLWRLVPEDVRNFIDILKGEGYEAYVVGGCVRDMLLGSDMVMFVTPLYYFGVSAQLKMVIDRFYSYTTRLSGRHLKSALIVAAWDSNDWTMSSVAEYYGTLCRYMNFDDQGMVLGTGCGTPSMTERSRFSERAYELGRSLRD